MRASIFKTICVLALAVAGLGLTGCCCQDATCRDQWAFYKQCDLIEGTTELRDCSPGCDPCR